LDIHTTRWSQLWKNPCGGKYRWYALCSFYASAASHESPRLSSHSRQMRPRHHMKAGRSRSGHRYEKLRKIFATHNESEGGDITTEDAPLADTVTVRSSLSHLPNRPLSREQVANICNSTQSLPRVMPTLRPRLKNLSARLPRLPYVRHKRPHCVLITPYADHLCSSPPLVMFLNFRSRLIKGALATPWGVTLLNNLRRFKLFSCSSGALEVH
jgi:hypothetical protein